MFSSLEEGKYNNVSEQSNMDYCKFKGYLLFAR